MNTIRSTALLWGIVAAMFYGCGSNSSGSDMLVNVDPSALVTGIAGEVRQSPTVPVARPGQIDWAPLADARITIDRESGEGVGTVVSDSAGRFGVALPAGRYRLTPQPFEGQILPTPPEPQIVNVVQGDVASVLFDYDTGIR